MINNFNVLLNDSNLNVMMYDINYINDNYKKMNINDFTVNLIMCFKYRIKPIKDLIKELDNGIIYRIFNDVFDIDYHIQIDFLKSVYVPILVEIEELGEILSPKVSFGIESLMIKNLISKSIEDYILFHYYSIWEDELEIYMDNEKDYINSLINNITNYVKPLLNKLRNIYKNTLYGKESMHKEYFLINVHFIIDNLINITNRLMYNKFTSHKYSLDDIKYLYNNNLLNDMSY